MVILSLLFMYNYFVHKFPQLALLHFSRLWIQLVLNNILFHFSFLLKVGVGKFSENFKKFENNYSISTILVNSEVTSKEKRLSPQQNNMTKEDKHSYYNINTSKYDESTEEAGTFYWLLYNWIYLNYFKAYLHLFALFTKCCL